MIMNNFLSNNSSLLNNNEKLSSGNQNKLDDTIFNRLLNDKRLQEDDVVKDNQLEILQAVALSNIFNGDLQESINTNFKNGDNLKKDFLISNVKMDSDTINVLENNIPNTNKIEIDSAFLDKLKPVLNQDDIKEIKEQSNKVFSDINQDKLNNDLKNIAENMVDKSNNIENKDATQKTTDEFRLEKIISSKKDEASNVKPDDGKNQVIKDVDDKIITDVKDSIKVLNTNNQNNQIQFEKTNTVQQNNVLELNESNETIQKISDYIQKSALSNSKEIEIQLNPNHLGKIVIKASARSDNTEVQITCFTEKTKDILTRYVNDIGEILQNRTGVETTIYIDSKQDDNIWNPNNQQENNRQQQDKERKEKPKQNDKSENNLDFIEQLRLGIS